MRHRKRGRRLGRSSSHRKAMLQNLASALILTERDAEFDENPPAVPGRVVTTLHKAKEVRPLVEKCVTIARRSLAHTKAAQEFAVDAERGSDEYQQWRKSEKWQKWADAIAPAVAARRRCVQLLGDKQAVRILFDEIAPRFEDRDGGYTRILKLAKPRLGDAGARAILEFVGVHDREVVRSEKPAFDDGGEDEAVTAPVATEEATAETGGESDAQDAAAEQPSEETTSEAEASGEGQEEEKKDDA